MHRIDDSIADPACTQKPNDNEVCGSVMAYALDILYITRVHKPPVPRAHSHRQPAERDKPFQGELSLPQDTRLVHIWSAE